MTFAEFIAEQGTATISSALSVDRSLVHVWKCRNDIPRKRWPALLVAFPKLKVDDLFVMQVASARAVAA